jgi:protein-S-isoprenylcysteine O-methyltransferase Ste14
MSPVCTQLVRGSLRILLVITIAGCLLFISAGRTSWMSAWLMLLLFLGSLMLGMIWRTKNSPELLMERGRLKSNVISWDKVIYAVCLVLMLVITGFDSQRYGWYGMPIAIQVSGLVLMSCSAWLIWRVLAENAFASRRARLQTGRGHKVVTARGYSYIRHPMYLGVIALMLSSPFALGSIWDLVPGGFISLLYVVRAILEDRMLKEELVGWKEYALKGRYRLIPRIGRPERVVMLRLTSRDGKIPCSARIGWKFCG